ncbi:MAG: DsbA family protein [Caulobacteraceae bacterium]|nr:DsbA family protein [Caulobacteraceae bacterium]
MASLVLTRRFALVGASAAVLAACSKHGGGGESGPQAAAALPDDMSLGNPNAKVHFVEYASVACPVCGRWFKEVWPAFKAKYVDTGKVYYTFREMLVGGSDEVTAAASGFLLARCAGKDKYFQMVDAIFNSQPDLFSDPRGVLLNIAKSAGMTEQQFDSCVGNADALNALQNRVEKNGKEGNIQATPTFVINGKAMDPGYHPLTEIDAAIAAAPSGTA